MSISNSPSLIIRNYLVAQGLFTLPSSSGTWPIYPTSLPDGVNVEGNAVGIYDEAPQIDGRVMTGEVCQHYGIKIELRALVYETGYLKLKSVLTDLSDVQKETVVVGANSYYFWAATKFSGVLNLGTESGTKRRYKFELNFNVTLEEV